MSHASPPFAGLFTALVTPMAPAGQCDWPALDALVDRQLEAHVDGLVVCGSTGEAATLTMDERVLALRRVVARAAGRCKILFGSGAQSTHATQRAQRLAEEAGADATLVVTPFYNRPSPQGLLRHFTAVADAAHIPLVLYNVPARTGCDLTPELVLALAQHPRVAGVKEATGLLDRITCLRAEAPADFAVLGGDDASAAAACLLGGDGLVSVAANLLPDAMAALVGAARQGDVARARADNQALQPLFAALSLESNPLPIKTALALRGDVQEAFRLPLCAMASDTRARLQRVLQAHGYL